MGGKTWTGPGSGYIPKNLSKGKGRSGNGLSNAAKISKKSPSPISKPAGIVKNVQSGGMPAEVKAFIRSNLTAVKAYIECLEDIMGGTASDTAATQNTQLQNYSSSESVDHINSRYQTAVPGPKTYQALPADQLLSFSSFMEEAFSLPIANNNDSNTSTRPSLPNEMVSDNSQSVSHDYEDINEQYKDAPLPIYPSRDYAAMYGVDAAFGVEDDDEEMFDDNEKPSDNSHPAQITQAVPAAIDPSVQARPQLYPNVHAPHRPTAHQQGRKMPAGMKKPGPVTSQNAPSKQTSTVAGQKRKREHPSQLQPASWLPPLSPAKPGLYDSIDHSTQNPSNEIRAYCPYPAPPEILTASKTMVDKNMESFLEKQEAGRNPSTNRIPWTVYEDDLIIKTMLEIRTDATVPQTEARFDVCIERIDWKAHGLFPRTHQGIKNMWCRVGRTRSGYDERKGFNQKPEHNRNGWKAKPGNTRAEKQANKAKKVKKMRLK